MQHRLKILEVLKVLIFFVKYGHNFCFFIGIKLTLLLNISISNITEKISKRQDKTGPNYKKSLKLPIVYPDKWKCWKQLHVAAFIYRVSGQNMWEMR